MQHFFDPLGLLSLIVLQPKLLFKKLCISKQDWDSILSTKYINKWYKFINELNYLKSISADPFVLCNHKVKQIELHGFCDRSTDAYCASNYIRVACLHRVEVSLCASIYCHIPFQGRLELMSCLLLFKLNATVGETVECKVVLFGMFCWSDSEVAFWWIRQQSKKQNAWIKNQVKDIRNYKSDSIGRMFHFILIHQTFPHDKYITKVHRIILIHQSIIFVAFIV